MTAKHTRLTVDLDYKDHKKLKAFAAIHGKSMREVVTEWIVINLESKPNKQTLKAIEKAQQGKDLKEIDLDDLIR